MSTDVRRPGPRRRAVADRSSSTRRRPAGDQVIDVEPDEPLERRALVNSARLTGALVASWTLALVGRFLLPRALGAERFGELAFIEGAAILSLAVMSFGVGGYIHREVAIDSSLVRRFARPLRRIQIITGLAMTSALAVTFAVTSGSEQGLIALVFGFGQMAIVLSRVDAAYLQAVHDVKAETSATVVTKAIWFALLVGLLGAGIELLALPVAVVVSETARGIWLRRAVLAKFGRPRRGRFKHGIDVMVKSLPYFLNALNVMFLGYSVRVLVGLISGDEIVGLLATAEVAIAVPMLLTPVMAQVSLPMLSALSTRSRRLMWRRTTQIVDVMAVPVVAGSVVLFALSDELMTLAFGSEYTDAGLAFGLLALSVPATYFTQVVGVSLIAVGRAWQNTRINLYTMILVVVMTIAALTLSSTDDPAHLTAWAAATLAIGEWVTVLALLWVQPLPPLRRPTSAALVVLGASAVGLAVVGRDPSDPAWLALCSVAVITAVVSLPRALSDIRSVLRLGRDVEAPADHHPRDDHDRKDARDIAHHDDVDVADRVGEDPDVEGFGRRGDGRRTTFRERAADHRPQPRSTSIRAGGTPPDRVDALDDRANGPDRRDATSQRDEDVRVQRLRDRSATYRAVRTDGLGVEARDDVDVDDAFDDAGEHVDDGDVDARDDVDVDDGFDDAGEDADDGDLDARDDVDVDDGFAVAAELDDHPPAHDASSEVETLDLAEDERTVSDHPRDRSVRHGSPLDVDRRDLDDQLDHHLDHHDGHHAVRGDARDRAGLGPESATSGDENGDAMDRGPRAARRRPGSTSGELDEYQINPRSNRRAAQLGSSETIGGHMDLMAARDSELTTAGGSKDSISDTTTRLVELNDTRGPGSRAPSGRVSVLRPAENNDDVSLFSVTPLRRWARYAAGAVRKHKFLFILAFVPAFLFVGIFLASKPPDYQTSATILLAGDDAIGGNEGVTFAASRQASQVILRRDSLDRMIEELSLAENRIEPPFFGRISESIFGELTGEALDEALRDQLRTSIFVSGNEGQATIDITVLWPDPVQAVDIAELGYEIFLEDRVRAEVEPRERAVEILAARAARANAAVNALKDELKVGPLDSGEQGSELDVASGIAADLTAQLRAAEVELDEARVGVPLRYALNSAPELPTAPLAGNLVLYVATLIAAVGFATGIAFWRERPRGRIMKAWQLERLGRPVVTTAPLNRPE